mmetsp:Transcript_6216/g.18021  ORF Transcript_6216/g.18021 Transcript_6216/m.18021 type:complete len:345 (-) Transcript_6216:245-1279(-)
MEVVAAALDSSCTKELNWTPTRRRQPVVPNFSSMAAGSRRSMSSAERQVTAMAYMRRKEGEEADSMHSSETGGAAPACGVRASPRFAKSATGGGGGAGEGGWWIRCSASAMSCARKRTPRPRSASSNRTATADFAQLKMPSSASTRSSRKALPNDQPTSMPSMVGTMSVPRLLRLARVSIQVLISAQAARRVKENSNWMCVGAGWLHGRSYFSEQRKSVLILKSSEASMSSHILLTMYAAVSVMKYEISLSDASIALRTKPPSGAVFSAHSAKHAVSKRGVQHQKTSPPIASGSASAPAVDLLRARRATEAIESRELVSFSSSSSRCLSRSSSRAAFRTDPIRT